jgi:hypothetical protein
VMVMAWLFFLLILCRLYLWYLIHTLDDARQHSTSPRPGTQGRKEKDKMTISS